MTLWAVRIYQPEGDFSSYFPVLTRDEGDESAYRVNDFMTSLNAKHGKAVVLHVAAEVIEWPGDAVEHAQALTMRVEENNELNQEINK